MESPEDEMRSSGIANPAIRERSHVLELQDILKEWLSEVEGGKDSPDG